jgi:predicted Zn-dependent protease
MPRQLALALAALLLAPGPVPARPADEAARSARGKELMAAGRYEEAVPVYRELARAAPQNPGLQLNLGMALHLSGQDQDALPPLEAAYEGLPDSYPAALFLGAARMALGRPADAVPPLRRALRLQPASREARSMLVDSYLAQNRPAEAEPHLVRLAREAPKDPAVWFALGKTYEALAGLSFQELSEKDPDSPFGLALLAEARLDEGRTTTAFRLYREAIARSPGQRGLHAAVAEIYRRTGHPEWAAAEEAKEQALPKANCARHVLECAYAEGRHYDVLTLSARAGTPAALYWRARASNQLAVAAFERLTALPPSVQSHEWAATVHRTSGRHAEAVEEWRQALALAPGDPALKVELAASLRAKQDLAEAQSLLEDALRRAPDFAEASYLLGDVLLARQQAEPAVAHLEKAVRLEPGMLEAHGALGRAYALVGRPADAVPHLEKALPTDADGSLRLQLARALQAAGEAGKARSALADYEAFRKARGEAEGGDEAGGGLTPP